MIFKINLNLRRKFLYNVWVSNGYTLPEPIRKAARHMHAVNVDLKGDDGFYKNVCITRGVKPVYDALREYKKRGVWTEITTLVIPGYNFDEAWVRSASAWIRKEIGPDTPLHFSAFFPNNRLRNAQPTPIGSLLRCREIAMEEGLRWVYIGNVPIGDADRKGRLQGPLLQGEVQEMRQENPGGREEVAEVANPAHYAAGVGRCKTFKYASCLYLLWLRPARSLRKRGSRTGG